MKANGIFINYTCYIEQWLEEYLEYCIRYDILQGCFYGDIIQVKLRHLLCMTINLIVAQLIDRFIKHALY